MKVRIVRWTPSILAPPHPSHREHLQRSRTRETGVRRRRRRQPVRALNTCRPHLRSDVSDERCVRVIQSCSLCASNAERIACIAIYRAQPPSTRTFGADFGKNNPNDDFSRTKKRGGKINNFALFKIAFTRNAFVCTVPVFVRLALVDYFLLRKTRIISPSAAHRVRNSFRRVRRQIRRPRCAGIVGSHHWQLSSSIFDNTYVYATWCGSDLVLEGGSIVR